MKIKFSVLWRSFLLIAAALPLVNCSSVPGGGAYDQPAPSEAPAPAVTRALRFGEDPIGRKMIDDLIAGDTKSKQNRSRPGLATQAGSEQYSSVSNTPFFRKVSAQPDAVDAFHYNDESGAKAMSDALGGGRRKSGPFPAAGGRLEVALRSGSWSGPYERYEAGDRRIVIGEGGSRYEIALTNRTKHAVEVVASVDGLDVMDGRTASVKKRGYVIPAKSQVVIDGFRISASKVKQFIFGTVDDSAAAKAGAARNVGVIGLAVYDEDEAQARLARLVESQQRSAANPFAASTQ
jgi:hypothetical protein